MHDREQNPDEMLSLDQVEAEFGIDRSTIYRHAKRGEISRFKRVGDRRVYYRRGDIQSLVVPRSVEVTRRNPRSVSDAG